jgi:hypothetical protein
MRWTVGWDKQPLCALALSTGLLTFSVGQLAAAEMQIAPTVPAWNGFYVGGDAGYGFGVTASTEPVNTDAKEIID